MMLLFFNNREKNSNFDNNLSSIITPAVHKSGRTYGKNIADYYMNLKLSTMFYLVAIMYVIK